MDRILAALIFFTRIPFWRIRQPDTRYFKQVVELWPLVGWLTGAVTSASLWLFFQAVTPVAAVACAYAVRLIVTGALHEDGLADFCDGIGGGTSRSRILEIMKDSHIGTYGVLGLTLYYIILVSVVAGLPLPLACATVFVADPFAKICTSQIINLLPYARTESQAKAKVTYSVMSPSRLLFNVLSGIIPPIFLFRHSPRLLFAIVPTMITTGMLVLLLRRRIGGYTGDCCGAVFLLSELAFIISISAIYNLSWI